MAKKKAMTDEEAFLAAIGVAPQDMLPRLVYADWLDERNDPRGGYLRLEVERHLAELASKTLEPSALTRLGELEDTLAIEWFYRVAITDYPPTTTASSTPGSGGRWTGIKRATAGCGNIWNGLRRTNSASWR